MGVVAFPIQTTRRYGDPVASRSSSVEVEQDEEIRDLAARLVAGDETSVEEIYDRWSALVHTFALRALNDTHDAEEVTQQVFVAVWRSRHTLTPSAVALPAWLIGIARNKIADARAARGRDVARIAAVVAVSDPTSTDMGASHFDLEVADRLVIRQAVQELTDPRRTIMFLAFWEDLTHAEIAASTGLPLGTVKSHVRRGLVQLHQHLEGVRRESR